MRLNWRPGITGNAPCRRTVGERYPVAGRPVPRPRHPAREEAEPTARNGESEPQLKALCERCYASSAAILRISASPDGTPRESGGVDSADALAFAPCGITLALEDRDTAGPFADCVDVPSVLRRRP